MDVAARCSPVSQAARYGVALLFISVLAGCATPGAQPHPWNPGGPRTLTMMSDSLGVVGEPTGPALKGYNVPGRNPDSRMPWELFLGSASHRLIAYMYGVKHPDRQVYYNIKHIKTLIEEAGLGDVSRLLPGEYKMSPDITDITRRVLFEIKPWHEQGLQEGREKARTYLAALNRTILAGKRFTGGTDFHGEVLIRFARGQYIWRLEWRTHEPGVLLYRWTRSQQRFESEKAAHEAGQWEELEADELRQYGGWVEKAVEDMLNRREKLATFSGAMGLVIDLVGNAAKVVLWGALLGQMDSGKGAQQPPAQGGGQLIPFPARPPPVAPPAQVPAAASMPLPR